MSDPTYISELLARKAELKAELAGIERKLCERNSYQLADARLALDVACAVCAATALDDPFALVEKTRAARHIVPRQWLHWILVRRCGWSTVRAGMHCERHHTAILHSVRAVEKSGDPESDTLTEILRWLKLS